MGKDVFPSSDRLSLILDHAPVAVYVSALDTWEILYANRLAAELLGCRPGGKATCYGLMGFERPCPFCRVGEMSDTEPHVREHVRGGRVYQLSGKVIDWAGIPAHLEYIHDITEKKRAEEASTALTRELRSLLDNMPGGLCVYRFDGEKLSPVFHNPAFYNLLGYSDEHIARTQRETNYLNVHPEDVEALKACIAAAIASEGVARHTHRVFHDGKKEYIWVQLELAARRQADGTSLLYGVYTDITERHQLERRLAEAHEKTQNIINAIPGGVAIYKVSDDAFETVYFSDGVPELSGYTVREYRELIKGDAAGMIHPEDTAMVVGKLRHALVHNETADFEFRKNHKDGHAVWVHIQAKKVGEEDGFPLLQCVFHNVSALRKTRQEMEHLVNSIPGGIAVYNVTDTLTPFFCSEGVAALSGYTKEEYQALRGNDAFRAVYEEDRERVRAAVLSAVRNGEPVEISYRILHKDGRLVWLHLNGRRMGALTDTSTFYAVFTGMSAESKLYQSLANEAADGIYVIGREDYSLLYVNERVNLFTDEKALVSGRKCYTALHGRRKPCEFCNIDRRNDGRKRQDMVIPGSDRIYATATRETDWNGIPAYVRYVTDITEKVRTRKEKERLERYYQTLIRHLPGGITVLRCAADGAIVPEFISDGFAAMTGMTLEQAYALYGSDAGAGVHPEDGDYVLARIRGLVETGQDSCETVYRLRKGEQGYIWVKNISALIPDEDGNVRIYAVFSDVTEDMNERAKLRSRYNDMLIQHHKGFVHGEIITGHCNITRNFIIEITDQTNSRLLETFGTAREPFFTGLAGLVVDENERRAFLESFLAPPLLAAFARGDLKHELECFVKLPAETQGRYVRIVVKLVVSPDSGDLIGVLSVLDVTEQKISEQILNRLAHASYDFLADVDLRRDSYKVLSFNHRASALPPSEGGYAAQAAYLLQSLVVPKDKEICARMLDRDYMCRRLEKEGSYSFHYSLTDENGEILTKNMVVFSIDKKLGRVCLSRTDITESVREQKALLNMLAYTFDLAGFLNLATGSFVIHTRETVLRNLAPHTTEDFDLALEKFIRHADTEEGQDEVRGQLSVETMLARLAEQPEGYEFTFPCRSEAGLRHKQISVLWGGENHQTICLVRADVTDVLRADQQTREQLKNALALAREASQAKTDFLSSMSHDIRTPMNAIVGMTELALARRDNPVQIDESLAVIRTASEHLLRLINDILDMSRIESGHIVLVKELFSQREEVEKIVTRSQALAGKKGQTFSHSFQVRHDKCIGDVLRIHQILENLISNAVKFTPEGGRVSFAVTELPQKNEQIGWYRFVVADTGIGISPEDIPHIFEVFFRVESARVGHTEGTGLGLSIIKNIVDYKGGTIKVESEPGQGTRFTVDLPLHLADAPDAPAPPEVAESVEEDVDISGLRVLLVEDNEVNQLVAQRILESEGVAVSIADNGKAGWEAFESSAPDAFDAVFMDIQMPVMDGYEATRAIRQSGHARAADIPVIAMTANAFAGDVRRCLNAGMNAHIAKPIEPGKLFELLWRHTRGRAS